MGASPGAAEAREEGGVAGVGARSCCQLRPSLRSCPSGAAVPFPAARSRGSGNPLELPPPPPPGPGQNEGCCGGVPRKHQSGGGCTGVERGIAALLPAALPVSPSRWPCEPFANPRPPCRAGHVPKQPPPVAGRPRAGCRGWTPTCLPSLPRAEWPQCAAGQLQGAGLSPPPGLARRQLQRRAPAWLSALLEKPRCGVAVGHTV